MDSIQHSGGQAVEKEAQSDERTSKLWPTVTNNESIGNGEVQVRQDQDQKNEQKHHFQLWPTIGVNYSLIGTPLSIGTYLSFNIGVGGGPVYVFGYIFAIFFQYAICASLAEVAACFPHSSGSFRVCPGLPERRE